MVALMRRPITLFTGQWADLTLAELAEKAAGWGFDGLELACWGDHFEVDRALAEPGYLRDKRELLDRHGLACFAVSTHLVGQAVCDPLDERHQNSIPAEIWGDGDPEGVHQRAAERMKDTARAAAAFGIDTVIGFTGSAIWHRLYGFPPPDPNVVERGYEQFAERWNPIIDVFESEGVRFALEVHPTEIAYDFVTTERTLDAIGRRPGFRLNFDPSHMVPQFLDAALFVEDFGEYIAHVHIKDSRRRLDGRRSILGSHLDFGHPRRGWDFVSAGRGDVDFEQLIRALGAVGYRGPLSIEWEDSAMDREAGAQEALAFIRGMDFEPSELTPMGQLGAEAASQ
jgi:sugar phosphate isomerase/epimerase